MTATLSLTELIEKRAALKDENIAVLDKAKDERREQLTTAEENEYDKRDVEIEDLDAKIRFAERTRATERRTFTDGLPRGRGPGGHAEDEDGDLESAVVAPNQSVRTFLERRNLLHKDDGPRVGFGQYIRAMVLGPQNDTERRALSEGTDSAGGYTVPDILSAELIDVLRKQTTVIRAGASTVPLQSDRQFIARLASDPVPAWRAENAAVAESDPTFERVEFTARSLAVLVKVSRELLEDTVNINQALPRVFGLALGLELDRVALIGTGTPPEPRGVKNSTGVSVFSMGTNGTAITNYDPILEARKLLQDANAAEMTAAIMAPRTDSTIAKFKDTTNQPLRRPPAIENVPFLVTTQIPITDTQGSSSNASRIYTGAWSELLIGVRTEMRVEVLRERFAENLQYAFLAFLRADIAVAHGPSFAQVVGIIP